MEDKKTPKISTLKSKIKKVLKEQGSYSPEMDFMIEITAGNLYAYHLILYDVMQLTSTTLIEITREGNHKKQAEPALRSLREHSEMTRKCLRELRLTLDTLDTFGEDEMDDLIDTVNNVE